MRQFVVWVSVIVVIGLIVIITISLVRMPPATPKIFPADRGTNFIDVSTYPPEMQKNYKLFEQKCSRCHTLARAINSELTGEAWRKYVYKMMRKPGSGLTSKTAEPIIKFLIYDSETRKKREPNTN